MWSSAYMIYIGRRTSSLWHLTLAQALILHETMRGVHPNTLKVSMMGIKDITMLGMLTLFYDRKLMLIG